MASLGSFIRSAARGTSSAYRRVPVRWRLGGGSAALTFVILAIFATAVGVLTDRQINDSFNESLAASVGTLALKMNPKLEPTGPKGALQLDCSRKLNLNTFAEADHAQIRVMTSSGELECSQLQKKYVDSGVSPKDLSHLPYFRIPPQTSGPYVDGGFRVEARQVTWKTKPKKGQTIHGYVLYARPISAVEHTIAEIRVWLTLGVLGGAVLALLAGLLVADRAMRPIAELTDVAREIERTRNPTLSIPKPTAKDEITELARTLEGMLGALDAARNESITALARQREFVADASHELRTPLTSVLANLELLADELFGEQADSAKSALIASRRMRRLVGDLLLLARADVERQKTMTTVDLDETLTDVAVELGPVSEDHLLEFNPEPTPLLGIKDDLHRMVLNLVENAINHTPPGTRIIASSRMDGAVPVLIVEDDGPGISPELQSHVFERFVRGGGDQGQSGTGLGLSIVSAVADAHDAQVILTSLPDLQGARFEIRFPPQGLPSDDTVGQPASAQTSTTTGRTIGRRRSRS